jgi:gas vesicle protein
MKVALLIAVVAIIGCFAEDAAESGPPPFTCDGNKFTCMFKELGHKIKYHAGKLGNNLKDVGTAVLSSALDQGKDLLANGAQAVLGTVLEHLTKEGLVGKREIAFFDKVKEHVNNGIDMVKKAKEAVHTAFKNAVDKLTGIISNVAGLKQIDDDADKQIDQAVEEFNKEGKKGFLAMASTIAKKLQEVFAAGIAKIRETFGKKDADKRAILGFDSLSDAWEKAKQHLSGVASGVSDAFKPHIENLKAGISALADKAKEHAGNLVDTATQSFNDLKNKLGQHVEALKGHASTLGDHATNAINALKEAIASIAVQAAGNVKNTLNDAINTGKDAAGTIKDHVSDAVSGY